MSGSEAAALHFAPAPSPGRPTRRDGRRYGRRIRRIALIAHDGKKDEILELIEAYLGTFREADLVATKTTGRLVAERFSLDVNRMASGPHGGDLQIGALVAHGEVDLVVFLRDPLAAHPHEPDIQALMKVCDVYRVPLATNGATAALCLDALERVGSGMPVAIR